MESGDRGGEANGGLVALCAGLFDLTECAICNSVCRNPHALPCLHTFCLPCIQSLLKRHEKTKQSISCPTCRHCFGKTVRLTNNFIFNSLVDERQKIVDNFRDNSYSDRLGKWRASREGMHSRFVKARENVPIERKNLTSSNNLEYEQLLKETQEEYELKVTRLNAKRDHFEEQITIYTKWKESSIDGKLAESEALLHTITNFSNRLETTSLAQNTLTCANETFEQSVSIATKITQLLLPPVHTAPPTRNYKTLILEDTGVAHAHVIRRTKKNVALPLVLPLVQSPQSPPRSRSRSSLPLAQSLPQVVDIV